jgi:ankyrin repeat protein
MKCSPLAIAAAHNHGDVVFELVGSGADLLSKDLYHIETALHSAVRQYNARTSYTDESREVASMLIWAMVGRGLTLDSVDECGRTALHLAVADNNESIVRSLLENGANIKLRDVSGATPLKCSILDQNAGIAKVLLEYGADFDERYNFGITPLHLSTKNKDKIMTSLLLGYGAEIEAKDFGGSRPYMDLNQ